MILFGLFGDPVAHSLSPAMHNAAFQHLKVAALYESYRVATAEEFLRIFRTRGLTGASITIPLKEAVMEVLDDLEPEARAVGAVNTVKAERGGLRGFNTDWIGVTVTLEEMTAIKGKRVVILGAGGTARAAIYAVIREGGVPVVINRGRRKGESLAATFGCDFRPWEEMEKVEGDILIHTTPVGMHPHGDHCPVGREILRRFSWVMDVIYNPPVTALLREAAAVGCRVMGGVSMFVIQGAEQFRIWTGLEPPVAVMKETVVGSLQKGCDING